MARESAIFILHCVAIIYESIKKRCSRLAPIPCFAGTSPGSEEVTHAGDHHLVATTVYSQGSFTFSEFPGKGSGECRRKCIVIIYESVKERCSRLAPIPCFAGTSPGSEEVTHAGNQHLVATTAYSQGGFTFSEFPGKGGSECRRKCIAITYESVKERCSRLAPIPCFAGTSPGSEEVTHAKESASSGYNCVFSG